MNAFQYLVLSGGGTNGFLHMGALVFIERWLFTQHKLNFLQYFRGIAGTSIGALLSLCLVCGMTTTEMMSISTVYLPRVLVLDFSIFTFNEIRGLRDNTILRECITEIFYTTTGKKDMTFSDLFAYSPCELHICACNIMTSSVEFFSHVTTPAVSVTDALLASMAVPLVFPPISIDGQLYIDGGCQLNLPISVFPVELTLALRIRENTEISTKPETFIEIVRQIFRTFYFSQDVVVNECYKENKANIVQLSAASTGILLTPVKNNALPIHRGYTATGMHLLKFSPYKMPSLFWLITEHVVLFIIKMFVHWCIWQNMIITFTSISVDTIL